MSALADELANLYNDQIMQRGRKPSHAGRPAHFDTSAKGDNPMCGDRIEVFVSRGDDATIEHASFEARGCYFSIASADLMAETIVGRTEADLRVLFEAFRRMVQTGECPACDPAMETLRPLAGVHESPSRIKCATLPWHALMAALDGKGVATSE